MPCMSRVCVIFLNSGRTVLKPFPICFWILSFQLIASIFFVCWKEQGLQMHNGTLFYAILSISECRYLVRTLSPYSGIENHFECELRRDKDLCHSSVRSFLRSLQFLILSFGRKTSLKFQRKAAMLLNGNKFVNHF